MTAAPRFIGRREVRTVAGVEHYQCAACAAWLDAGQYYPAAGTGNRCRCPVMGVCKACHKRRIRAAQQRRRVSHLAYLRDYYHAHKAVGL